MKFQIKSLDGAVSASKGIPGTVYSYGGSPVMLLKAPESFSSYDWPCQEYGCTIPFIYLESGLYALFDPEARLVPVGRIQPT